MHNPENIPSRTLSQIWAMLCDPDTPPATPDKSDLARQDEEGMTLLHMAARAGRHDMATFLIEQGAACNARNKIGETPLDIALAYGFEKTARALNHAGGKTAADIHAAENWTGENWAAEEKDMPAGAPMKLLAAARLGKMPGIIAAIKAGKHPPLTVADLARRDDTGDSALTVLYQQKQLTLVLDPGLWAGRSGQMAELIGHIPDGARKTIDCESLLYQARLLSLGRASRRRQGP